METLPKDVNIEILRKLSGDEIINLCQSSKHLSGVCSSDVRYNLLWKLKIEEEFKEVYNGDNAYNQYKYLKKLHKQTLYILYYRAGEDMTEDAVLGIYDTYGKAVMAGVFYFREFLKEERGIEVPIENIKYLLWNRNTARFDEDYVVTIKKAQLNNLDEVIDERKFFSDREKLFMDIFGKPSEGKASQIKNTFQPRFQPRKPGFGAKKIKDKEMDFFSDLDNSIYKISSSTKELTDAEVRKMVRTHFEKSEFNEEQYKILEDFILKNSILSRMRL